MTQETIQKEKGLREQLKELNENLSLIKETKGKKKELKLPYKVKAAMKKAANKRKIIVFLLGTDRQIRPTLAEIKYGIVFVNGQAHQATTDFVYYYRNTPTLIIPEWSLTPIGTQDYYEAVEQGKTIEPQTIILRAMEAAQNQMLKNKMSGKMLIYVLIGAAILGYVLFGRG